MASIKFPSAPTLNQLFSSSGRSWKWSGTRWVNYTVPLVIEQTQIASLSTDLAAKASAAEVATKASLTGAETLANKTLAGPVLSSGLLSGFTREKMFKNSSAFGVAGWAFNVDNGLLQWSTSNATANGDVTVSTGAGSGTINSIMSADEALTITFMVTNGSTAYKVGNLIIDGTTVTPKWINGTAPSAGNANSLDIYTFTIVKTANAAFTVLASMSKFA